MKIGIMQPYFLPYLGYWQLMNHVDEYIILDDVNYIKRGWVNRNRILLNNKDYMITLPLVKASAFKKINENRLGEVPSSILKTIELAYHRAPYYKEGMAIVEEILAFQEKNLARFLIHSIKRIAQYLDIHANILVASELGHNPELKGQSMILDICKMRDATEYYNTIAGRELYSPGLFEENNIKLFFVSPCLNEYVQFKNQFVAGLSIIDVIMFNAKTDIKNMLVQFELSSGE